MDVVHFETLKNDALKQQIVTQGQVFGSNLQENRYVRKNKKFYDELLESIDQVSKLKTIQIRKTK